MNQPTQELHLGTRMDSEPSRSPAIGNKQGDSRTHKEAPSRPPAWPVLSVSRNVADPHQARLRLLHLGDCRSERRVVACPRLAPGRSRVYRDS